MDSQIVTQVFFRFYGALDDFLPRDKRHRTFSVTVKGRPSVKDTVEALGVPHPEIDIILVNRHSKTFGYQLVPGDRVAVYPAGFHVSVSPLKRLRPCVRQARFVIDSHLGKLVRHLRLLGFDCVYKKDFPDAEIVRIAQQEARIVLTRDIGLLKNGTVRAGLWVRSPDPQLQLKEVLKKYGLISRIKPFRLCLECNGRILRVAKREVLGQLPEMVRETYSRFYSCRSCGKVYWKGSHYDQLSGLIRRLVTSRSGR
ncbi:MAG: DUF5615 family PIN-like protein [Candidatus Omnitrophota bacterium]